MYLVNSRDFGIIIGMDSSRLSFYLLAFLAGAIGAFGDGFLNLWAKRGGGTLTIFLGFLSWNIALLLFLRLLKTDLLAAVVIIFLVANIAVALLLSQFYFHESVSLQKWIGIGVALLGVFILELSK